MILYDSHVSGSLTISSSVTVGGTLTAQTIVAQTITSSIEFVTGSTRNGSLLTDTHQFTGSVLMTGSLTVNGISAILGSGTTNYLPKFTGTTALGNSNIQDSGTLITLGSNTYLGSNSLAIGTSTGYSSTGISVTNGKILTGNTVAAMIAGYATIASDVTSTAYGVFIGNYMQAAAFTLSNYYYYYAAQQSTGGGSTITNQYGYYVGDLAAGTSNYSFYGNTTAGTNKFNLYMNGTANNYMAGSLGIGITGLTQYSLRVAKNITGNVFSFGINQSGTVQSDVTSAGWGFQNQLYTAAASFTLSNYYHFFAEQQTIGAGSTVNNQYGFFVSSTLTSATNNYGFRGQIPSASNNWNIYMDGTANNYMAGALGIGTTSLTAINLNIGKNITGAVTSYGVHQTGIVQSDVTTQGLGFQNQLSTQATSFTLSEYRHFSATQGTIGAGSVITTQTGYHVSSNLTSATNNWGFRGAIASGTNRYNIYMDGTANNYLAGSLLIGSVTDNGEKLQVTGTTRLNGSVSVSGSLFVSGSSSFTGSVGITGSLTVNGPTTIISASLDYQQNLAVTTGSFQTIVSAATGSFRSAFFDYVAYSGSTVRAGTLVSTWSGSVTEYFENYTGDLGGSTSVVTLQTAISASNIVLQAGISGSAWSVRSLVRLL